MPQITLKQLRSIALPAQSEKEPDHITAIRNALTAHEGQKDSVKLGVPESIAALIPTEPTVPAPADPIPTEPTALAEGSAVDEGDADDSEGDK